MVSRPPRRNAILIHGLGNVAPCSRIIVRTESKLPTDPSSLLQRHLKQSSSPTKLHQSSQQKILGSHFGKAQRSVSFSKTKDVHEFDPQHNESLWWTTEELAEMQRASVLEETDDELVRHPYLAASSLDIKK